MQAHHLTLPAGHYFHTPLSSFSPSLDNCFPISHIYKSYPPTPPSSPIIQTQGRWGWAWAEILVSTINTCTCICHYNDKKLNDFTTLSFFNSWKFGKYITNIWLLFLNPLFPNLICFSPWREHSSALLGFFFSISFCRLVVWHLYSSISSADVSTSFVYLWDVWIVGHHHWRRGLWVGAVKT